MCRGGRGSRWSRAIFHKKLASHLANGRAITQSTTNPWGQKQKDYTRTHIKYQSGGRGPWTPTCLEHNIPLTCNWRLDPWHVEPQDKPKPLATGEAPQTIGFHDQRDHVIPEGAKTINDVLEVVVNHIVACENKAKAMLMPKGTRVHAHVQHTLGACGSRARVRETVHTSAWKHAPTHMHTNTRTYMD